MGIRNRRWRGDGRESPTVSTRSISLVSLNTLSGSERSPHRNATDPPGHPHSSPSMARSALLAELGGSSATATKLGLSIDNCQYDAIAINRRSSITEFLRHGKRRATNSSRMPQPLQQPAPPRDIEGRNHHSLF
jgi:hypothetical protein